MRLPLEWFARAVALIAVGAALWMWQFPHSADRLSAVIAFRDGAATQASVASVATLLRASNNNGVRLSLSSVPERETRALLHAARDAGWTVEWNVRDGARSASAPIAVSARVNAKANAVFVAASALAVAATPRNHPAGGTILQVAAANDVQLTLSDSLGWIDSVRVTGEGTFWEIPGESRSFTVSSPTSAASVDGIALDTLKRIRVIGATGWESRFMLDALESTGWQVDASFAIAPRVTITAGAPATIDTSRYAAVIALDSTAWREATAIARFVRSGGGLLLFPASARGTAFAPLRAGTVGTALAGIPGALRSTTATEGLAFTPITALADDAVVMARSEREGAPVAVAARRIGGGRVVQIGFEQTWEWRMLGGDNAVQAHSEWWSTMLQRVAYARPVSVLERWQPLPGDAAPLADFIARTGGPAELLSENEGPPAPSAPPPWLFVLAAAALLVEWWSRRLRGAP